MPSDETRRLLKLFGVAVTSLEDAIDRKAPLDEIAKWDQELAERTRETIAFVERLRSRRVAWGRGGPVRRAPRPRGRARRAGSCRWSRAPPSSCARWASRTHWWA